MSALPSKVSSSAVKWKWQAQMSVLMMAGWIGLYISSNIALYMSVEPMYGPKYALLSAVLLQLIFIAVVQLIKHRR